MSKLKVLDKKSEKSINSEREFLSKLHNPFIVNMYYAFQDSENLYLVMDLMTGGDLRFHISRHKKFSEEQTRFFICGIIISLEYIHGNNVIHRDIKPENLVLDENGYVRLTDFGIAKENMPDNKSETSGTPGYMSPEVMKALNHSFPVDFFALGVIGYEFMKGERPYVGRNRKEIKEQILAKQAELKPEDISEGWSKESADFINKLLIRKPENRIGYKGINELKVHPWLKYYPWEMLYKKTLPSPFIPENKDNFDRRYCESSDVITEETKLRYEEILMDDIYKSAFKKFYYNSDEDIKRKNNPNIIRSKNKSNNKNNKASNSSKIIISQNNKTLTEMNNHNNLNNNLCINNNTNINNNKKSSSKSKKLKNSMKIIPSTTRNIIIKNHKKSGSVVNYSKNFNNNNVNTNAGGNVSNNVIYINFNINDPNITGNVYNNNQNSNPKTDRVNKQYKSSAKNIYCGGNTISNNNSLIHKIGINIGNFISPASSVKKMKNNLGSGDKKVISNINHNRNHLKNNKNKKEVNSLNSEVNKIKNMKNNKNTHNSMKDMYDLKNKTTVIESPDTKKPEESKLKENPISLTKSNNEIKSKKKNMSNSYSIKELLINEEKKENSLIKQNSKLNINNQLNESNINHYSIKKVFLKNNSPEENNKKNNMTNDSTSIPNFIKDKPCKSSRAYINSYNSKNIDISVNKSKTFLNEKQPLKEIKEIFKSNKLKSKENIGGYKNKSKNNHLNKKNYFSNDINYNKKKNMNRNSEINLPHSKNKNSSFDNLDEKEILIKTVNQNKDQIRSQNNNNNNNMTLNRTIISINKKMQQKKMNHIESTKLISEKNKKDYINNNKLNFFTPIDDNKFKNKNLIKGKQSQGQTSNLSISSIVIKANKKDISNSSVNINNCQSKDNDETKGFISARNNYENHHNDNRKSMTFKTNDDNKKNIIISYKQKPKSKMNK